MILMTVDHASHAFNAGRYTADAAAWYVPGSEMPAAQFMIRWVTHLCAPAFIFLAGFVLALSVARRLQAQSSGANVDRFILKRGVFILLLDPIWMSIGFGRTMLFQVLYAIGGGFCCMALLRRINPRILLAVAVAMFGLMEVPARLMDWRHAGRFLETTAAFLFTGGRVAERIYVLYPLLPWLAFMLLGWSFGCLYRQRPGRFGFYSFLATGAACLAVFMVVRALNGYGNMGLYRDDATLLQWLHVSKYPPSLSFASLELGILFVLLAVLHRYGRRRSFSPWNPINVFGRTPLFFYLLHVHLLVAAAWLLGLHHAGGLTETFLAALATLTVLYPLCSSYWKLKGRYPSGVLSYI